MKKKRNKNFTILFIPEDNARTVTIRVNGFLIRFLIALLLFFALGIAGLLYFSGGIALKLQMVFSLRNENSRLRKEKAVLAGLAQKVEKIEEMNEYFRRLAQGTGAEPGREQTGLLETAVHVDKDMAPGSIDSSGDQKNENETNQATGENKEILFETTPYIRPVEGWITREFISGPGMQDVHRGLDFAAAQGTPVRVTAPGIVKEISNDRYFGKMVTIEHLFGFVTRYGHCAQILVNAGDHVTRGQTIALVGNTGRSSAAHLHYEILKNGEYIDPRRYIIDTEFD